MFDDYTTLFKATWGGRLGDAEDEIFSYSRWYVGGDTATAASVADALSGDITDFLAESTTGTTPFSNLGQLFPTHVQWERLSVWSYDEVTGLWNSDQPREDRELTDAGLGASSQGLPYQCALAVTLRAAMADRRRRNRWYLPPMSSTGTDGKGRMLPTLVDDIQTQYVFQELAHRTDDLISSAVYSRFDHLARKPVDFYTGEIMDTIRRRRNHLVDTRHTLEIV